MCKYVFPIALAISLFFISCDPNDNTDNDNNLDLYNRADILLNWADNIIIPAYESFHSSLLSLNEDIISFIENPTIELLESVSDSWFNAYKLWQHVEMFDIGYAEVINYKGKMNIYPTDIDLINQNIIDQNYDLNNNNNFDSRGFPAMDYMLHGLAQDENSIIDVYLSNSEYSNYLVAIINAMMDNTNLVIDDWDSFRSEFINSIDNTATSALNKMTNDFIYYFEKGFRANKIGIPAGIFSNDVIPSSVEAFYKADVSKVLAIEALMATKNFFQGKHFNSDVFSPSLESYLDALVVSSNNNLSETILLQFLDAENTLNQLDDNFITQIETNNMQMLLAYDAIQQLVVSFKVDMLQSLSISVDYVDADGD
mgnify:CR=1 FL=1